MQLALIERSVALALDGLAALAAFWLAWVLRYAFEVGGQLPFWAEEPFSTFVPITVTTMVLTPIVFVTRGIYRIDRNDGLLESVGEVIGGYTTAVAGVVALAFFLRFEPSRLVFFYAWLIGIALMVSHRWVLQAIRHRLWRAGIGVDRVMIVEMAGDVSVDVVDGMLSGRRYSRIATVDVSGNDPEMVSEVAKAAAAVFPGAVNEFLVADGSPGATV